VRKSPLLPTSRSRQPLRQAEAGTSIAEITRKLGISDSDVLTRGANALVASEPPRSANCASLREENGPASSGSSRILTLDRQVLQGRR